MAGSLVCWLIRKIMKTRQITYRGRYITVLLVYDRTALCPDTSRNFLRGLPLVYGQANPLVRVCCSRQRCQHQRQVEILHPPEVCLWPGSSADPLRGSTTNHLHSRWTVSKPTSLGNTEDNIRRPLHMIILHSFHLVLWCWCAGIPSERMPTTKLVSPSLTFP